MTPNQLQNIRTQAGLTQEELAKKVGVSVHAVRKWEQGQRAVPKPVEKLIKLITDKH